MTFTRPGRLEVLICGGGIAGATLACLLARAGHHATVVEHDRTARTSGNPVDVRRPAFDIMEDLGLVSRLRDLATHVRQLVLVDETGRPITSMPTRRSQDREIEIPRADLTAVLVAAARADTEFCFGDSILELDGDDRGVDVTFRRAAPQRFDLVVGADGVHSTVRRLMFGPEPDHLTHLGLYVATVSLPGPADHAETILMHNEPGTATALHPGTGSPAAIFIFRSSAQIDTRHTDAADQLLTDTYRTAGWRAQEFLAAYRAAPDTYFDSVSRVKIPTWTNGRVTLLGDAASCVSLLGDGSTSAIVGAAALATSLDRFPQSVPAALAHYEATHRPVTARGQRAAPFASHLLVPASATGITLRNRALRLAHGISPMSRSWR